MNLLTAETEQLTASLCSALSQMPLSERVHALNQIRQTLHAISPFAEEPVDCVLWLAADTIQANDYNPNTVAPPEMRLLTRSIQEDGYTQPIVGCQESPNGQPLATTVVDGFHRRRVGVENPVVRRRTHGYLPVTLIRTKQNGRKERMAATIRHNRARGVHGVVPMADIVAQLIQQGWDDAEVAQELGMEADEVLRFKQNKGLPELFREATYSKAWE